jgi:LemA protein
MWYSPLFWIAIAFIVFWALGAYNRLMRLRSAVIQTFGGFDAHTQRLLALLAELTAAQAAGRATAAMPQAQADGPMTALEGAAAHFSATLAAARARPLHPDAIAALAAAQNNLHACWSDTMHHHASPATPSVDESQVAAGEPPGRTAQVDELPGSMAVSLSAALHSVMPWQIRWGENVAHVSHALQVFNDAVRQYNEAIAQFPASVLARLFGFKAARGL